MRAAAKPRMKRMRSMTMAKGMRDKEKEQSEAFVAWHKCESFSL